MDMPRIRTWAALLTALSLAGVARATYPEKYMALTAARPPADAIPLGSDGCNHTFDRAGYPDTVSKCARPTNMPQYAGYYVGGGCVFKGGPPVYGAQQGTWGFDYVGGCVFCPHVMLGFCYNCRYQGGIGSYSPDGKHVFNIFGIHIPKEECECAEGEHHAEHEGHEPHVGQKAEAHEGHEGHEGHEAHPHQ
jgi:hypothetical protein